MEKKNNEKMPVLFIGHGNPMHVLETNPFTKSLTELGKSLKTKPKAIMVISAHWLTNGTYVNVKDKPEIIYDFYGFPKELYQVKYPVMGAPKIARETMNLAKEVKEDNEWGLDHGAWCILKHIFPKADIPVFQLSIDSKKQIEYHYNLGKKLNELREQGVLIIGSGNIVHNLQFYFRNENDRSYDWALEFDEIVKNMIINRDFKSLINYEKFGNSAKLSVPTTDHYIPLMYCLALAEDNEEITFTYEEVIRSMSMRCLKIG